MKQPIFLFLVIWAVAALAISASGVLAHLPVPPPAIAVALTILLLLAVRFSRAVRAAVLILGPGPLVAFHRLRIVAGGYFLVLYGRGVLPGEFALPAGWGDIAVGFASILVAWRCLPLNTRGRRTGLLGWNIVGLIDILAVLANGLRLFATDPSLAQPFTYLPLALLPTFVVPVVIVSHVLLFGFIHAPSQPAVPQSDGPPSGGLRL